MITREMFLEALEKMKDASEVIEAYQMQFEEVVKPKDELKDKRLLVVGDEVECVEIHRNSEGKLTIGKRYPVKRTKELHRGGLLFSIENDRGKIRDYNSKNSQFKALK
ncbi:hypothetical protein [Flavobacterium johnsoniae]|uniref:Uncharacterized protein n=1 Tax=Flavobacterium johnsoniae TaxID=986 RepID=A0A1M5IG47_FLAJO|nr:hypothetical protein [Flavobacterium johnsoniae]SHG27261.1 hypothetical protein SAMN05444388_10286 [Flavobacterium johnsoniae]